MKKLTYSIAILLVTILLTSLWNVQDLVAQNIVITDDDFYVAELKTEVENLKSLIYSSSKK